MGKLRVNMAKGSILDFEDSETVKYRFEVDMAGCLVIYKQEMETKFGTSTKPQVWKVKAAGTWESVTFDEE